MTAPTQPRKTAVVVGASMAGLSAAAVLSSRFDSVVIVERDDLPDGPADRKGVPQGRHAHGLLPSGLSRLVEWFPGITEELLAAGATYVDIGSDASWYQGGGHRVRFRTGLAGPVSSRAMLEHVVRQRTLALPNVTLRAGAGASGLTATPDRSTVTGVTLEDGTTLAADLVVDASGRRGRSLLWMRQLGYVPPATTEIDVDVAYASRVVRVTGDVPEWKFAIVLAGPPTGRQGVAFPVEGDGRFMVTLAGVHGDRPPSDDAGFLAFARSLPSPEIADLLDAAVPTGPIVTHRLRSNQRRHVERLRRVPGGLVMLGDAVCSFNPTYGQGMSTATLQAEALGQALDTVPALDARFVKAFYKRAAKAITPAWQMTTGADFALPATTGRKAPGTDLLNRYMASVFRASQVSETVAMRVIEVTTLLRPPPALLTPAMLVRVFRASRKAARVVPATPQPVRQPVAA
ncbi:MAG TPA: FAD-dependent monooxygenase [Acidimicrobiales bacterium]|nr:FAD-dependent monooxygenase [Acidimicrobiales bacterium]